VDFSDILHTCWHKGPDVLEKCKTQAMIRLHKLYNIYHPREMFISFDGVPPFMKMKLKRSNVYSNKYTDARDPATIPESTDIALKACSVFVSSVETELRHRIDDHYFDGTRVFVNSTLTPGEGEYKIIDYINTLPNGYVKYIYSPDSDMIMLSLLSNKPNIFIINKSEEPIFLNIDELRYRIANFFDDRVRRTNYGFISNIIKHFCIVCLSLFKNDYVPMPFIKYHFNNVMYAFKQYIYENGLNFFNRDGHILFINVLKMMKYIDDYRADEKYPIKQAYSTFDFVVVKDDEITSTKYEDDAIRLINSEEIYHIIHDMSKSSMKEDEFIKSSCYNYMLLIDWMFNCYLRTPRLNMRFNYNFSFIPLIKTVYNIITKGSRVIIPKLVEDECKILFNGDRYYTNEQFVLYTFDPLRLSNIMVITGYDATSGTEVINPHCDLFTQMVPAQMRISPIARQIHSNSFILMKVQVHKDSEDNYIVLSYGYDVDINIIVYLRK